MYVITGATGNIGRTLAEILLDAGKPVKVIGRSADRLKPLADKGAEIAVGSLEDEAFLTETFRGATAVYAMIPPDLQAEDVRKYQNQIGEAIANAIVKAGVTHVVHLSSLGAHLPDKTGPITGLYDQEQRLNKFDSVNVLHLRPTYFLENLMAFIPMIRNMGMSGSAVKSDIVFPMIATQDIAKEAAERMIMLDFSGHTVKELLGQRDVSMREAMGILGAAAKITDLKYVEFPYDEAEKAIQQAGLSADMARSYVELQRCVNDGLAITDAVRTPEKTTETSIEDFAAVWASIYDSM
jgi:uncharacterized protein YbjT (DUF2867 family)